MVLFNNLVLPLWSRYWLRFQESYENVISSLTTSSATCPAPSGNVIINRSSSTLSLTSHISILILSVLLFLLPLSHTLHTAALWNDVYWLQKELWRKRSESKETIQSKQIKAERKLLNHAWLCCIMDFMATLQNHFSLVIWGLLYLFSARLVCTIKSKKWSPQTSSRVCL